MATETAVPFVGSAITTSQQYRDRYSPTQPDMIDASYGSTALAVANSGNTAVTVQNGGSIVQAARYDLTSGPLSLSVAANGGGSNRFDIVCLTYDSSHSPPIYSRIVQGTPGAGLPALTNSRTGVWDFPLAHYEKQPGGNIVNLVDRRIFSDGMGGVVASNVSYLSPSPNVGQRILTKPGDITYRWSGSAWVAVDFGPPIIVLKSADETINNNNTLQDDNHLLFTPPAINAGYRLKFFIAQDSGTTAPDFKLQFTLPAGATYLWTPNGITPSDANQEAGNDAGYIKRSLVVSGSKVIGSLTTTTVSLIDGFLFMGGTSGPVTLQWAQNTATATNTIVRTNSFLWAQRVY